ncbi:hypothetical protein ABBQ38_002646 [Trebouxia sp. C0009 RCD-2024]
MSWTVELIREQFPFVQIGSLNLLNNSLLTSQALDKEVVSTVLREAILPELLKWTGIFGTSTDGNITPILNSLLPTLNGLSLGLNGVRPEVASTVFNNFQNGTVAYVVDQEFYEKAGHVVEHALVCKLVLEGKACPLHSWSSGSGGCFQLAAHMLPYGMQQFKSGYRSPVYGIELAMNRWASTELHVDGFVKVEEGVVTQMPDDMSLDAQHRVDSAMSQAQIADGEHILARYFIGDMPATGFSWCPPTPPAFHLIELLLKICIGAPVHEWSVADVKAKLADYHDRNHTQAGF